MVTIGDKISELPSLVSINGAENIPVQKGGKNYKIPASIFKNIIAMGIKKSYASVSAMQADGTAPVGNDGTPLKAGDLVSIWNPSNAKDPDNNSIYAFTNPGWSKQSQQYVVDSELSETSTNPVENGVISSELNKTVKTYSEDDTYKSKSIQVETDKMLVRYQDPYTTKNLPVYRMKGDYALIADVNYFDNAVMQHRFSQAIREIAIKGNYKITSNTITDSSFPYIRTLAYISASEGVTKRNLTIYFSGIKLGEFDILTDSSNSKDIVRYEFKPNTGDARTNILSGYAIIDNSMLSGLSDVVLGLDNTQWKKTKIKITELEYDRATSSIFTNELSKEYTAIEYFELCNRYKSISLSGVSEPIYMTSVNKQDLGDTISLEIILSYKRKGVRKDVAKVYNSNVNKDSIAELDIVPIDNSNVSGKILLDTYKSYYIFNWSANIGSEIDKHQVVCYTQIPSLYAYRNMPDLTRPMIPIKTTQSDKVIRCVCADGAIYYTKNFEGNVILWKTNDIQQDGQKVWTSSIYISFVKETNDGELLVFTGHDAGSDDLSGKGVFKSSSNRTVFNRVITPSTKYVTWALYGFFQYGKYVIIAEYGPFSADPSKRGSRYLYLSSDYGNTFSPIIDMVNPPSFFDGFDKDGCHIHGACYDPYRGRLWIVTGDMVNSQMVAFSDNLGVTWQGKRCVDIQTDSGLSKKPQFISVFPLPNCVLLSPDSSYNAILRIDNRWSNDIIVSEAYVLDNPDIITHLVNDYKRFGVSEPLLIQFGTGDDSIPPQDKDRHNFILSTFDGISFIKIWEDNNMTVYPYKGVDLFKIGGRYVVDIDNTTPKEGGQGYDKKHNIIELTDPIYL